VKKPRLVRVDWLDSAGSARWSAKRKMTATHCSSVGWLTHKSKTTLTISASRNDQGDWADQTAIPRSVVTRVRRLR
jgi:hypothetical protein